MVVNHVATEAYLRSAINPTLVNNYLSSEAPKEPSSAPVSNLFIATETQADSDLDLCSHDIKSTLPAFRESISVQDTGHNSIHRAPLPPSGHNPTPAHHISNSDQSNIETFCAKRRIFRVTPLHAMHSPIKGNPLRFSNYVETFDAKRCKLASVPHHVMVARATDAPT